MRDVADLTVCALGWLYIGSSAGVPWFPSLLLGLFFGGEAVVIRRYRRDASLKRGVLWVSLAINVALPVLVGTRWLGWQGLLPGVGAGLLMGALVAFILRVGPFSRQGDQ